jgi:2-polyprenyl-3-methyl-5-hydroxy-6-metoxy-1,4-benzoquinol methylase
LPEKPDLQDLSLTTPPKPTSYPYGRDYQLNQAEKYRQRNYNHWKQRISLAHHLVETYALPKMEKSKQHNPVVLDIGCSIGTFAIEFAKKGYPSYGIDFDPTALKIAGELAKEEHVCPVFIQGDVSDLNADFPPIDLAICFDVFEHLHDDELGALLVSLKKRLSKDGSLVFHTCPTQYEYIFYGLPTIRTMLIPFAFLPAKWFDVLVKMYANLLENMLLLRKGVTYSEKLKLRTHCNPTTQQRLTDTLHRLGYEIVFIESANVYDITSPVAKYFFRQPISYYNLYGVVTPI